MTSLAKTVSVAIALCMIGTFSQAQEHIIEPDGSYLFAERDTCNLYLDEYFPRTGSQTSIDGIRKPTILFAFGGGFMEGSKREPAYLPWIKKLTEDGFTVVTFDYRLGLKGVSKMGIAQAKLLQSAIYLAVEDLFSATAFMIRNSDHMGIDPDNIVLAGSSAGAITVLQADWEQCNRTSLTYELPEHFRFAGVMSFAGAIYSETGIPEYKREPAPTLLLHGTADKLVTYKKIKFLNLVFAGTDALAPIFLENGYSVNVLRFKNHGHEISIAQMPAYEEEMRFIETNVMRKEKRIIDALIDDPAIPIPDWARITADDLYR